LPGVRKVLVLGIEAENVMGSEVRSRSCIHSNPYEKLYSSVLYSLVRVDRAM
jgi:hypothetical protein